MKFLLNFGFLKDLNSNSAPLKKMLSRSKKKIIKQKNKNKKYNKKN